MLLWAAPLARPPVAAGEWALRLQRALTDRAALVAEAQLMAPNGLREAPWPFVEPVVKPFRRLVDESRPPGAVGRV